MTDEIQKIIILRGNQYLPEKTVGILIGKINGRWYGEFPSLASTLTAYAAGHVSIGIEGVDFERIKSRSSPG